MNWRGAAIDNLRLLVIALLLSGCSYKHATEIEKGTPPQIVIEMDYLLPPEYPQSKQDSWKLIWNDEFSNQDFLKKWNIQVWPSDKNGEWQYYTEDNVSIKDGYLRIETKKELYKGRKYTSGAITTEGHFEFTYGKVEIKAKLPKGRGMFPAFWLVNSNTPDWLPEIDIMENLGQYPNEVYFVIHWKEPSGKKERDYFHYISDVDFSDGFHLFGVIWEEDRIIWTVDNKKLFETEKYSPDVPLFLYVNTAVGGYWPGPPDPTETYPKELLVDYIRVYQKEGD